MKIGIERLVDDLSVMGYQNVETLVDSANLSYAVLRDFEIPAGSFAGRVIDLAIPAPVDYPRTVGASIHIKASPILVKTGAVAGLRNVQASNLGDDWQYWSYQFIVPPGNPTAELITKINDTFRKN